MFNVVRQSWASHVFRRNALWTFGLLIPVLIVFPRFLAVIEHRSGVIFSDPLLVLLPAFDLTWVIFGCMYGGIILAVFLLLRQPDAFLLALRAYALMAIIRMIAMWLMPLDPPPGMIALKDPFVEFVASGTTLTRDLFFSGHTATLVMLALAIPGRYGKLTLASMAVIVGVSVLIQHVHYGIDVYAAPFFAYCAYSIARGMLKQGELN
jgi:hypothetical protein